jgi:predicted PurR-regulated permease PerM
MSRSQVSLRTVFTVCFGLMVMALLAYALLQTRLAITVTLLAALIAVALDHAVALLQRRRLPRWLAITTVCVMVLGIGGGLGALIIPAAVAQTQILAQSAPELAGNIRNTHTFEVLDAQFGISAAIERAGRAAPTVIFAAINAVAEVLFTGVAVVLLAVFMLIFGAPLIERGLDEMDAAPGQRLREILATVYRLLGGYVFGIILIAVCNAIAIGTFLAIMGMPFFLPLAMLSALASMVPYAGSLIIAVVISVVALATLGTWPTVACVIFFIIHGQIEGNLLGPLIFRRTAKVNPLVTLLAILFFGTMGGIIGAFLAIPLVGVAHIVLVESRLFRRDQRLGPRETIVTP